VRAMMEMIEEISIIGAGGNMGSWFLRHFSKKSKMKVLAYDRKVLHKPPPKVTLCSNVHHCVRDADLVLVCVPIASAPSVIRDCALSMKSGAILAEISSVKAKTFLELKKYSGKILPLCIHPMFGPGASSIRDTRVLLIPVKNQKKESDVLSSLLRGSEIIVLPTAQVHDRYMAIILGLTYFLNMTFAELLSHEDIPYLQKIAGTFFKTQLLLTQGILSDDPNLIVSIMSQNLYTKKYVSEYLAHTEILTRIIKEKRDSELLSDLIKVKSIFGRNIDLQLSYRNIYSGFKRQ
jgi:prephenate dehydrogenase